MYTEIKGAIEAARTVYDIAKAAHGLQGHAELLAAVTVVQERLQGALIANLELLEKQSSLQTRLEDAEQRAAKAESVNSLRAQYKLAKVYGGLVMAPRTEPTEGMPVRYLCVNCLDQERITTLQQLGDMLLCNSCKLSFRLHPRPPEPPIPSKSSWDRDW